MENLEERFLVYDSWSEKDIQIRLAQLQNKLEQHGIESFGSLELEEFKYLVDREIKKWMESACV